MAALRNRIIHGYFRIDYSIVWDVIVNDLPEVKPAIFTILRDMDQHS
ncbi:HepT-like ribonuclease domain-containing protein [Methanoregula sp.]